MDKLPANNNMKDGDELPKCNAKVIVNGEIIECLEPKPLCQQYFHFGNSIYCKHPLRLEIAKRTRQENETKSATA